MGERPRCLRMLSGAHLHKTYMSPNTEIAYGWRAVIWHSSAWIPGPWTQTGRVWVFESECHLPCWSYSWLQGPCNGLGAWVRFRTSPAVFPSAHFVFSGAVILDLALNGTTMVVQLFGRVSSSRNLLYLLRSSKVLCCLLPQLRFIFVIVIGLVSSGSLRVIWFATITRLQATRAVEILACFVHPIT